jgi:hypothetical protein
LGIDCEVTDKLREWEITRGGSLSLMGTYIGKGNVAGVDVSPLAEK